jgi:voltage-dependent potassium channel beta subunit
MLYRKLGRSGLSVSALSFGSWVSYSYQLDTSAARECMAAAFDAGVNFFDNAEVYAFGKSEEIMGAALRELKYPRLEYAVTTKLYWGLQKPDTMAAVNGRNTLNRKYLMQAMDGSLKRFGLDFIDVVYCHRADANTPLEETVRAFNDIITQGKALYWGTSEWSAAEIMAAWAIADRYGWHKPVVEQPQYNLFNRKRVENEYARLYTETGLGLTTWSPLASGLLTGKYKNGIPDDSRGALENYAFLREKLTSEKHNAIVTQLEVVAKELNCTLAQLALAWCVKNERVSSVITGASKVSQVKENMKALEVLPKLTAEVMKRITEIVGSNYE